jgi:Zn-dependent membrane protease YugP
MPPEPFAPPHDPSPVYRAGYARPAAPEPDTRWLVGFPAALAALGRGLCAPRRWLAAIRPPSAVAWLLVLGAVALLWGVYQYARVLRGVGAAWPILALWILPVVVCALMQSLGRIYQLAGTVRFADSAGTWLRDRLARAPELGVSLAALEEDNRDHFYHPASRTIVLGDRARDTATAAAYAVAAHELGHALMHHRAPRCSAFALWCRGAGDALFRHGMVLWLGAALLGHAPARYLAVGLVAAAAALRLVVALDEGLASVVAMRELRALTAAAEPRRAARRYLLAAFSTYAGAALAYATPLLLWPQLRDIFGVIVPGAPLAGAAAHLATIAAVLVLLGPVAAVALAARPAQRGWPLFLSGLGVVAFHFFAAPLLVALLIGQPLAAATPWAVLLATFSATALAWPLGLALLVLVVQLPQLEIPSAPLLPLAPLPGLELRKLSLESLRHSVSARRKILRGLVAGALAAPLAVLHLLTLLR